MGQHLVMARIVGRLEELGRCKLELTGLLNGVGTGRNGIDMLRAWRAHKTGVSHLRLLMDELLLYLLKVCLLGERIIIPGVVVPLSYWFHSQLIELGSVHSHLALTPDVRRPGEPLNRRLHVGGVGHVVTWESIHGHIAKSLSIENLLVLLVGMPHDGNARPRDLMVRECRHVALI